MKKRKILITIDNLGGGGAEKVLITLLNNLSKEKYEIDLFLINNFGIYIKDIPDWINYNYFFSYPTKRFSLLLTRLIRKIFFIYPRLFYWFKLKKRYDIEIGFREGYSTKIILSSINRNSTKISWLHTNVEKHNLSKINKKKYFDKLTKIDKIVCVSENVEDVLLRNYPNLKGKTKVIYNPINIEGIVNLGKEDCPEIQNDRIFRLITVGKLDRDKNQSFLIECVKYLKKLKIETKLYILGTGHLEDYLNHLIIENKLEDNIKLVGFQQNPYKWISKCDLFVFSSIYEGLPTVLIEAMALHIPIISTYCTGAEEILSDGDYGELSNHDIVVFSNKIKHYLFNSDKQKFDTHIRLNNFKLNKQIKQIERLFDGLSE